MFDLINILNQTSQTNVIIRVARRSQKKKKIFFSLYFHLFARKKSFKLLLQCSRKKPASIQEKKMQNKKNFQILK